MCIRDRPVTQRLTQSPGPIRIGIISGHRGNDSGSVCEDGLTEAEVVENIAARVIAGLQTHGITADLLDEFDARLQGYVATGLVSIHADSCDYINDLATGFKIAGSGYTDSSALSICVEGAYRQATPVSYTHLDVYKRQVIRRKAVFFIRTSTCSRLKIVQIAKAPFGGRVRLLVGRLGRRPPWRSEEQE